MAERITVTNRLTPKARRGWDKGCELGGVTLTAPLEAIGCDLDDDPRRLLNRGADLIEAARIIDQERRSRR